MMSSELSRVRILIVGAVQGVGFRPFVWRLAKELGLVGWVQNSSGGVSIEAEGGRERLDTFLLRLQKENPPHSFIQNLETSFLDPIGYRTFDIRQSNGRGEKTTLVLPDIATCEDCLSEIFDPLDRRFRYPFTNCTHCGPRYSIIEALPYDRSNTTMRGFLMCKTCQEEYGDPSDRRFHAQPNCCPECGPYLKLWDKKGKVLATQDEALLLGCDAIRLGSILAVKGLGGFHLLVDSRSDEVVTRLRRRKNREEKPFAIMVPSLKEVKDHCEVSDLEERLLTSPESPIVLLKRRGGKGVKPEGSPAEEVAPKNSYLGIMLPYTPLHHLLMEELGIPVVATSGNLSDEPISTNEYEALDRLGDIADFFLVHNRPIARHVDDSVVRVIMGRNLILRRARGYAPLPIHLKDSLPSVLALGGHLKNTIAISRDRDVFISQHIGDLETVQAFDAFKRVIRSFQELYDHHPEKVVCDFHPDYLSTKFARESPVPVFSVQHHYAHILSCMAENELEGTLLGVAWDGSGYAPDGTLWGGEFLQVTEKSFHRVAHFRTFRLPGGEKAIQEPRRSAIGLLHELFGESIWKEGDLLPLQEFSKRELGILEGMLKGKINSPLTSSAGRLFDAVAALVGVRQRSSFEGQAAMELEFALDGFESEEAYPFGISVDESWSEAPSFVVDWAPFVLRILEDVKGKTPLPKISAKFHNTLVEIILAVSRRVGEERVILTGGCFQNKYLTERTIQRLKNENFRPYWHERIPPNDGGIVLGQAVSVLRSL